jgi:hypothetical protein
MCGVFPDPDIPAIAGYLYPPSLFHPKGAEEVSPAPSLFFLVAVVPIFPVAAWVPGSLVFSDSRSVTRTAVSFPELPLRLGHRADFEAGVICLVALDLGAVG